MRRLLLDFSAADAEPMPADVRFDFERLRRLGPWAAVRRLRAERFDECVVRVAELRRPRRWLAMLAGGLLARATSRRVVDASGAGFELTW